MTKIIEIIIASFVILFFSRPFLNPAGMGIVIQRAPQISRQLATGAAAGAGIIMNMWNDARRGSRSGNYLPPMHDRRMTDSDDTFDGTNTPSSARGPRRR